MHCHLQVTATHAKKKTVPNHTGSLPSGTTAAAQPKDHLAASAETNTNGTTTTATTAAGTQMKPFLGHFDPSTIPGFPTLASALTDNNCDSTENGMTFDICYKQHCLTIVSAVGELNLSR